MAWTAKDLPDYTGKTVLITGANSGIGKEAAREFVRVGAHVVLACRNTEKANAAAAEIGGSTDVRSLDLADLGSVRAFADGWSGPINVLINNAGIMAPPLTRTADGFEMQLGTNHLGHFALTNLLLPSVTDRVVTVASLAHKTGKIELDDLNWEQRSYRRWPAYGQSKLANLLFTLELGKKLAAAGSSVRAVAAHPGYASTNLQGHTGSALQGIAMKLGNVLLAQSGPAGAWPTLFAASQDLPSGAYIGPDRVAEMRGHPRVTEPNAAGRDEQMAAALWERSVTLTGTDFALTTTPA